MASRGGKRAAGTDGMDYMHRERVANHYEISSLNKGRVKWTAVFHLALLMLMLARLSNELFPLAKLDVPPVIKQLRLPKPEFWELAWLPSFLASVFGYLSLKRNNSSLMWQSLLGHIAMGLAPVCYGIYLHYPAFIEFINSKSGISMDSIAIAPLTWAWLIIALQVHIFHLYFTQQLLSAWRSSTVRKSKQQ